MSIRDVNKLVKYQAEPCKCSCGPLELPSQILLDLYRRLGCHDSSLSMSVCMESICYILNIASHVLY